VLLVEGFSIGLGDVPHAAPKPVKDAQQTVKNAVVLAVNVLAVVGTVLRNALRVAKNVIARLAS